ncbi:MFS general substrate transporter [Artomyces pyxidatus]|uniref:MFS general substrate transporter n=1 Tax=Artomyces pyxidatus TaxID=48021 RepID=A0ACB8SXE7_9AGAM|nr:MFS general substrate transporter [Artomyces pyxidatus]
MASDVPDGGWWAWSTVAGAVLIQFTAGYVRHSSYLLNYFVRYFLSNSSSSDISWIGSVATFLTLSGGFVTGRYFDNGYFFHLLIVGGALVTFCLFMLSLAQPQNYYQVFLSLGLGFGIGTGTTYVPSIAIVAQHFSHKRALVMGIASSGSSLGSLLHPIMLNNLIHGSVGFANGVRASAGMMAGIFVLAGLMIRTRYPPRKDRARIGFTAAVKTFVKDDVYMLAVLGTFFVTQGIFFPLFYIQLDAVQHGFDKTFDFYSLSILSFFSFVGRIAGGAVVNRLGVFNTVIGISCGCGVLLFSMLAVDNIAGFVIFAVLYGFFSGAYISLMGPLFASLAMDVGTLDFINGFRSILSSRMAGTPIVGALLTRQFIWWRPIVYCAATSMLGAAFFWACRVIIGKRKGTGWC